MMMSLHSKSDFNNNSVFREKHLTEPRNKIKNERFQELFQQLYKNETQKNASKTSLVLMDKIMRAEPDYEYENLKKKPSSGPQFRLSEFVKKMDAKKKDGASLNNMIYETSPRLMELAKPRRIEPSINRNEVYHIPRKVLKAEASPRIIELSQPRQYLSPDMTEREILKYRKSKSISAIARMAQRTTEGKKPANKDHNVPEPKQKKKQTTKVSKVESFNSDNSVIDVKSKKSIFKNTKYFKKSYKKVKSTLENRPVFK